jgi:hypothetical protein
MNNLHSCLAMVAAAVLPTLPGIAGETYRIETSAFVFKQSDFHSVEASAGQAPETAGVVVAHAPATLAFDGDTLELRGAEFAWSRGAPPRLFNPIGLPAIFVEPDKAVKIRSAAPMQYLEKQADGTLRVRDLTRDSPDVPHCQLQLSLKAPDAADGSLRLACDLDLTAVSGRAAVPGVNLDVGRPVLASFKDRIQLALRPGEWTAVRLPAAQGGADRLLLLLRAVPAAATEIPVAQVEQIDTAQDLALFMTNYYRHPRPEMISRAIEVVETGDFLKAGDPQMFGYVIRRNIMTGFFGEVFAANPDRVAEWRRVIDRTVDDHLIQTSFDAALELAESGGVDESRPDYSTPGKLLGAFLASGDKGYVRKLVEQFAQAKDDKWSIYDARSTSMMMLAYNVPSHPAIRQALEEARPTASPLGRKLIDDLLGKKLEAVRHVVERMSADRTFPAGGANLNNSTNPWGIPLPGAPIH